MHSFCFLIQRGDPWKKNFIRKKHGLKWLKMASNAFQTQLIIFFLKKKVWKIPHLQLGEAVRTGSFSKLSKKKK